MTSSRTLKWWLWREVKKCSPPIKWDDLCCFHLLACCLTLFRFALRTPLAVSEPRDIAATRLQFQSSVTLRLWLIAERRWSELNRIQLSAIHRCRQCGKFIYFVYLSILSRRYLLLGHPWASSGSCTFVQISLSKWLSGKQQASQKAAIRVRLSSALVT